MPVGIIVDYYEQKFESCNVAITVARKASEKVSKAVQAARSTLDKHEQEKRVYDPKAHDEQDNKVIDAEYVRLSKLRVEEEKCSKELKLLYKKRAAIRAKLEKWQPHAYFAGATAPQ